MDPQVSTSFIPKKTMVPTRVRGSAVGLILLLAILVFIASIVAAGGVFAYQRFLTSSIVSKGDSLQKAQAAYDPGAIESLIRLNTRINEAQKVVDKHLAASAVFTFLGEQTLARVQLTSFDYKVAEDNSASLSIEGTADTFSTLALQSDQFGSTNVLRDVIFSNIVINPTNGKVNFTVQADVDPSFILYSKNLTAAPAAVEQTNIVSTTTPTVGTSTTQ